MDFEIFSQKPIVPQKKEERKEDINVDRREFLKMMGKVGVVALAASAGLTGEGCKPKEKEKSQEKFLKEEDKIPEKIFIEETNEEGYVDDEDIKTAREAINFNSKGEIVIDRSVYDKTRREWEERYTTKPGLVESLASGISGIEPYLPELRKIFKEKEIPQELLFLAIPESHWQSKVSSKKGAKGVYQFTKETGRMYELTINDFIDEREDPLKSAEACAKYLKELHNKCGQDWELALSGYNGGFIWKYLQLCGISGKKPDYNGFLEYITRGVNKVKNETKNNKFVTHKVCNGETLEKIAAIYKIDKNALVEYNNLFQKEKTRKKLIKNKKEKKVPRKIAELKKGQELKIPLMDKKKRSLFKVREAAFMFKTAGYLENLVYPPKYVAVLKLIKKARPDWFEGKSLIGKNNEKKYAAANRANESLD